MTEPIPENAAPAVLGADVIIVGAGPCGVTLANHLGMYGVATLIVEKSPEVLDYPRAVGADDEALRSWQAVGLAHEVLRDMIQNVPARYYNSRGQCFAEVAPREQPFGWPRRNLFIQPLTETTLRRGLARYAHVQLKLGMEVEALHQDAAGVTLAARDAAGQSWSLSGRYVVGADGGRSTVRSLVGIELDGKTDSNKWLVVDLMNDTLYAPYTAIHCSPLRPSMSINLPYGYRRLEFQIKPHETDDEVLEPVHLARLLRQHYPEPMALPEIKRARIYQHHSRIAERFQAGRVFLAGDAAHLQPPFFGQGMNSGLRDATNLAWKLAWVIKHGAAEKVLASYNSERRDHALAMVNFATWIGSFYQPWSALTECVRDVFFKCLRILPGARDYILQLKFKPMSRYLDGIVLHTPALSARKDNPVGRLFMQPTVEIDGSQVKLDDVIGPAFAVIGVRLDPLRCMAAAQAAAFKALGGKTLAVRFSKSIDRLVAPGSDTLEAEDVQGRWRDWILQNPQWPVIILRPDRYVAAVCDAAGLDATLALLIAKLK